MHTQTAINARVLVVEDDEGIAQLIRFILEAEGYEVHWAPDGLAALDCMARLAPPALVTLDIGLPHVPGDEIARRIRLTPGWEAVPIVMITATPSQDAALEFLQKPFKPAELRSLAQRLIG